MMYPEILLEEGYLKDDQIELFFKNIPYKSITTNQSVYNNLYRYHDKDINFYDSMPFGSAKFIDACDQFGCEGVFYERHRFNYINQINLELPMLNRNFQTVENFIVYLNTLLKFKINHKIFIRSDNALVKPFRGIKLTVSGCKVFLINLLNKLKNKNEKRLFLADYIVYDEIRKIDNQYQVFIIDGKPLLCTDVNNNFNNMKLSITIYKEIRRICATWLPNQNCIMNVAVIDDKLYIIDFDCINCQIPNSYIQDKINSIYKYLYDLHLTKLEVISTNSYGY